MSFDDPFESPFGGEAEPGAPAIPGPDAPAATWSVEVYLAGADVSAALTGQVAIEAEESTARLATFTLKPTAGTVDVRDLIGAAVTIDYVPGVGDQERLFTGKVIEPVYDPETRLIRFECSDGLQQYFEAKTEAQILAAITGGKYDDQVFGDRSDGWRQAEDVLSTVAAGGDLLKDGVTFSLTAWDPKETSDLAYSAANSRFITVEIARLREITNTVDILAEYRYSREHHREHQFLWQWNGLCNYLDAPYELPSRDMVYQASQGLRWINKAGGICFETLPDSGTYCGGKALSVTDEAQDQLCIMATWRGVRRWTQTISESYNLTIQESGSVASYGVLIAEDGAGLQIDNDDAGWDASLETDDPATPSGGSLAGYTTENCGTTGLTDGTCWAWTDKGDAAARTNFLGTLLQLAEVRIRGSHRRNYVTWQTWILPTLERTFTLEISAGGIEAKGKVYHFRHELDIGRGSALTTIKIAVSKCPAGGSADTVAVPDQPDTETGYSDPESNTVLDTYIGATDAADPYNEDWNGYTGNLVSVVGSPTNDQFYPRRFKVTGPDIEDVARDEITGTVTDTFEITVTDGTLTVEA